MHGQCPLLAMLGAKQLPVLGLSVKAAAGPLRGSAGAPWWGRQPRLPRGSVPSALRGADRRTQRGAGGGRKLLIPLYLPLALLSCLPVWPAISRSCSRSSLPAWRLSSPRPLLTHQRAPQSTSPPSRACMLSISSGSRQVPGTGLCSSCALQVGVFPKDAGCSWVLGTSPKSSSGFSHGSCATPSLTPLLCTPTAPAGQGAVGTGGSGSTVNVAAPKRAARDQLI